MKITFFKKSKDLSSVRKKLIKDLSYDHGYSILRSSKSLKEHEFLFELSKNYDEYGFMSQSLGDELDELFLDDNYSIGIHRTGYTNIDDEMLNKIFNEGLINNGHIMSGGMSGNTDIDKTVSIYEDFPLLNGQLKSAAGYKNSKGCIVVKIPKSYLGKKDGDVKPIYYQKRGIMMLLPEFIYGYIPVEKQGVLGEIIRNPRYKETHDLDCDNLFYEDSVLIKSRKIGINLEKPKHSLEVCSSILVKAYSETLEKYGKRQAEHALLSLINNNDVQYFTGTINRAN